MTISAVLFKVATSVLTDIGKRGLANLIKQDYVAKAIEITAGEFPQMEGLDYALRSLCSSEAFEGLLKELKSGEKDLSGDEIVAAFINDSNFFAGSETEQYALKILATFAEKLDQEIYRSEDGMVHLANRMEMLHVKTGEKVAEQLLVGLNEKLSRLQLPLPSDNIDTVPEVKEKMLHAKIDLARDLLQKGKSISAKNILLDLRKEAEKQGASDDVYFRIATNLGACALDVTDNPTAIIEFNRALDYHPEDPKALTNCALARIIANKPQEALELSIRARERARNDSHATCFYLQSLNLLGRAQDIEDLLTAEPWISEDKTCSLALGDINLKKGHYEKAEQYLRKAVELDAGNAAAYELLGLSIFLPIQNQLQSCPPLLGSLSKTVIQNLNEIDGILTTAIDLAKESESRIKVHEIYINRAGVRGILGRYDDALKDCDYVLTEDRTNRVALQNKGRILLSKNLYPEAIECFEKAGDSSIQIPLAHAYMESKRFDDAVNLLETLWKTETDESRLIMVADLLLQLYHELNNSDKMREMMQSISFRWPNNPETLASAAHQYRREGAIEAAVDCIEQALRLADGPQSDWLNYELANLLYEQKEYGKAAKIYSLITNAAIDSVLTQKYLSALYNAGEYREALTIARSLRINNNGQPIPFISEIETFVLEYIEDIATAKELLGQLSLVEPAKIKHKLRLAFMNLRTGNDVEARAILEKISVDELRDDAEALIRVAHARAYLGMPDALIFAYRARSIAPDSSEIQSAYLGLFFGPLAGNISIAEPPTVDIDTVVYLQRVDVKTDGRAEMNPDGEVRIYVIQEEEQDNLRAHRLSPTSTLAGRLIGKCKQDIVSLKEGPYEVLAYKITDIRNKYLYAAQEIMQDFSTLFPDNPSFHRIEIKDHDLSKIFESIDARHEMVAGAIKAYRNKPIPLGALASVTGSNIIDIMAGMWKIDDGIIVASQGVPEITEKESEMIRSADNILLDLSSLYTLAMLNLLDKIPFLFKTIFVPQAVIDDIGQLIMTRTSDTGPTMSLGKEGDHYVRSDITADDVRKSREFLQRMVDFIQAKAEIVPSTAVFSLGKAKVEQLEDLFGKSSIAAISAAKEREVLLYSDDLYLRIYAERDWNVKGTWTQPILQNLAEKKIITDDEYHRAVVTLAIARYSFVSINADTILWSLEQNGMASTFETGRVFEILHGPTCSEDSAIVTSVLLIRKLWLGNFLIEQKLRVLDMTLEALVAGRRGLTVLKKFKAGLGIALKFHPLAAQEIIKNIEIWERQKLLH